MNVSDKLRAFSVTAVQEAEDKKKELIDRIEAEYADACAAYAAEARGRFELAFQDERRKAGREKNREILAAKSEARRSLYELKAQLAEGVFARVRARIAAYTETRDYSRALWAGIKELAAKHPGEIEVSLRSADIGGAGELPPNLRLVPDDSLAGGFRARIPEKNIIIDHSYKERLEKAREEFNFFRLG